MMAYLNLSLGPLVVLGVGALVLLVLDAVCWPRVPGAATGYLALCVCLLALSVALAIPMDGSTSAPGGTGLMLDAYARFHVLIVLVCLVAVVLMRIQHLRGERTDTGEQLPFLLLAGCAAGLLASTTDVLVAALALAVGWVSLAAATSSERSGRAATQAGTTLLYSGVLSTGLALYAAVLVYGATGAMDMEALFPVSGTAEVASPGLPALSAALLVVALALAIAVMPFHGWAMDAAGGAATPTAGLVVIVPRIGGIALLGRLGLLADGGGPWPTVLIVLGCVAALGGYLLAIDQRSISRLLGCVGVAHGGLCLVGVALGTNEGISGAMVQLLAYGMAASGSYAVLVLLRRAAGGGVSIELLRGLGQRHPALAVPLALFMGVLAGFPFTGGFIGRVSILEAVVETGRWGVAVWLTVVLVVAAYVHLRIIAMMWGAAGNAAPPPPPPHAEGVAVVLVLVLATLGLGLWPALVVGAAEAAAAAL